MLRVIAIAPLLFLSGMCALIFQVAWLREFRLVFGGSTAASGAVLAIFMGGLGLGNALLGPWADRSPRPLRLYAAFELLIALSAAVSPFLIDFIRERYIQLGGQASLGLAGATATRLALSILVLGVPTVLMGGTLPSAARAVTGAADAKRRWLALLYGSNTLGAVLGAGLSTFALLELLGTRATLWLACAVNLTVSLVAWLLSRNISPLPDQVYLIPAPSRRQKRPAQQTASDPVGLSSPALPAPFVYASAAIVGFAFFLMELVWYRMLGPLLGGTTFTFGLILAVALLGIGLGGAAYALLFRRLEPTARTFALTCGLEAALIALPFALGDRLAIQAALYRAQYEASFLDLIEGWAIIAAIVVLPAAFVSGVQFPLLIALLGKANRDVGKQSGLAFAWNTAGAIAGSLAGGFGVLPLLSAPGAWMAVVAILCALGLAALGLSVRIENRSWTSVLPLASVGVALSLLLATGPTAVWRHSGIGAGRAGVPEQNPNELRHWINEHRRRVVWEAEGVESSVAISVIDSLAFVVNGKSDGNAIADAGTQIMLGVLGALLHPEPTTGLVIGLGTGESAGWLAEVPSMSRVDVVELEPAIDEVARRCAPVNHDALNHPKIHQVFNDGREALLTSPQRYDLIVSEPSNPYRAGVAALYTQEFYHAARDRLGERGIFVQWLQGYEVDDQTVDTVLATLRSVFGHVEIWQSKAVDLLLVCSVDGIAYDGKTLRQRVAVEPFKSALARAWRAADLEGSLAHYVAGPASVNLMAERATAVNTDDRSILEYSFARTLGRGMWFSIEQLRERAVALGSHRPPIQGGDIQWSAVEEQRLSLYALFGPNVPLHVYLPADQQTRGRALGLSLVGDSRGVIAEWEAQPAAPADPIQLAALAHAYADLGSDKAMSLIDRLRAFEPVEGQMATALLYWRQGKLEAAVAAIEESFRQMRENPWPWSLLANSAFAAAADIAEQDPQYAARIHAALQYPFAMSRFEDRRRATAYVVSERLGPAAIVESLARFEPHVPWKKHLLQLRAQTYSQVGHPLKAQAQRDLQSFLDNESNSRR